MAVADVFLVNGVQGDLAKGKGGFAEAGGHDFVLSSSSIKNTRDLVLLSLPALPASDTAPASAFRKR